MTVRPAAVWGGDNLLQQIQVGDQAIIGDVAVVSPPIAGSTVTLSAWRTVLNDTALIATLTVALPINPVDRQTHYITTRTAVGALTMAATSLIGASPVALAAGGTIGFMYVAAASAWVRIQ